MIKMVQFVLILNVSYEFLNVASMRRALKLIFKGKAEVVQEHPSAELVSPGMRMKAPSIIRMLYYIVKPFKDVPFTRKNILLRDNHICQYCGKFGNTVDHIIPKSRGGKELWTNCVCACARCNTRKNNRTPAEAGMKLMKSPVRPMYITWITGKSGMNADYWKKYLA